MLASPRYSRTLPGEGQRVLAAPHLAVADAEIAQAMARSGGKAGFPAASSRYSLDGFLGGGQRVLAAPHLGVADAEVAQAPGEVGREGRVGGGQLAVRLDGFLGGASASWRRPTSL